MIYSRHYIQFNDLVFGEYELTSEGDSDVSFKNTSTEYGGNRHGSYMPMKSGLFTKSGRVALTLTLDMRRLLCSLRPYYRRFVLSQINHPGKLWAVQDNTLIWAYAVLSGFSSPTRQRKNELEISLDFELPEGVWHKADKQRTFVLPYDICDFMDCYRFKDVDPCRNIKDCCDCTEIHDAQEDNCCECDCDSVEEEYALCYFNDYQGLYKCYRNYRIVYDCDAGERFFSDGFIGDRYIGQKLAGDCGLIIGKLYVDTDIDTRDVSIRLHGAMTNPYIEINGNGNWIEGDFDGVLIINSDGSVYSGKLDCDACTPLDVDAWKVPEDMDYGWTIHPGYNLIRIQTNGCCGPNTAYFDIGSLTY